MLRRTDRKVLEVFFCNHAIMLLEEQKTVSCESRVQLVTFKRVLNLSQSDPGRLYWHWAAWQRTMLQSTHVCSKARLWWGCMWKHGGALAEPMLNHSMSYCKSYCKSIFSHVRWGNFPVASPSHTCRVYLLPVHHIPVDSGQDLDLGSCNVYGGYHRQRGLYGRSLWGNIHQNFIRLHPYNDYSLGHTKYLRGSVLFFAQGRCQEKSCTDSLTWLRMRIKTYRITL